MVYNFLRFINIIRAKTQTLFQIFVYCEINIFLSGEIISFLFIFFYKLMSMFLQQIIISNPCVGVAYFSSLINSCMRVMAIKTFCSLRRENSAFVSFQQNINHYFGIKRDISVILIWSWLEGIYTSEIAKFDCNYKKLI